MKPGIHEAGAIRSSFYDFRVPLGAINCNRRAQNCISMQEKADTRWVSVFSQFDVQKENSGLIYQDRLKDRLWIGSPPN